MSDAVRVVLFGAGASFGSEHVSPTRPPLGAGLYDELCRVYPDAWGILPAAARHQFVPNFELGMKQLWETGGHDVPVLLRCIAQYFTQFRALHGNTYARLLEHLAFRGALEGTYFSSLNYECIFEIAARQYGIRSIEYAPKSPSTANELSVWKLHGSCNFLPSSIAAASAAVSFSANAVTWDGEVRIVDPVEARAFIERSAFYPAMAVYMEGKPIHSHPALIYEFQRKWTDAVASAVAIGLVGVAPNPADVHLWKPLAEAEGTVVAIGDESALTAWASSSRTGRKTIVLGRRFAESLLQFAEIFGGR